MLRTKAEKGMTRAVNFWGESKADICCFDKHWRCGKGTDTE